MVSASENQAEDGGERKSFSSENNQSDKWLMCVSSDYSEWLNEELV